MKTIASSLIFLFSCGSIAQEKEHFNDEKTLYDSGYALFRFYEDFEIEKKINEYDSVVDTENELRKSMIRIKEALLEQALDYFNQVVEKHPESKYYAAALYNKAGTEYELGDRVAKETYLSLINNSKIKNDSLDKSFILPSFYFLAELEYQDRNYHKSLKYINTLLENPQFPIGSDLYYAEMIDHAYIAGKNYIGLGNNEKAIEVMLPYIISPKHIDNWDLARQTARLIKNKYGVQRAIELFDKAANKIYFNEKGRKYYYIKFLDTNIEIPYKPKTGVIDRSQTEEIKTLVNNSEFKLLINRSFI